MKHTYAIIKYDENGEIISEDYSKLINILNQIINNNLKEIYIKNPLTNQRETTKIIHSYLLLKLNLSEIEMQYAIKYLTDKNILVKGRDISSKKDFNAYQNNSTYKNEELPPSLSEEENKLLFQKLKQAKKEQNKKETLQIRKQLIEGNMRLVNYILYQKLPSNIDEHDREEIYQIAYEILINFIDKYDKNKGYNLSTAINNYLIYHIWRNYYDIDMLFIPVHMREKINQVLKAKEELENTLHRPAAKEEIATKLDLTDRELSDILEAYPLQQIESLDELGTIIEPEEQFYDYPIEEAPEERFVGTSSIGLPELEISDSSTREKLEEALSTLKKEEALAIRLHFGLYDGEPYSFDDCALIMNLKREIVRSLIAKGLRKLRHPIRSNKLRNLDDIVSEDRYKHKR